MKTYRILTLLILLVATSSCEKFLDTKPQDFLAPDQYYKTEAHLNVALNSVYATLKADGLYADQMLARMGLEADEGFMSDAGQLAGVSGYLASAGDPLIVKYWSTLYSGINDANLLLEHVDAAEVKKETKDIIKGQAMFLRAYYYYMLVKAFGNVPLILVSAKSPNAEEVQLPKSTVKEVYDFIYSEMVTSADLVENISKVGHGGKVTKSAVWGILARVSLNMAGRPLGDVSKYAEARKWAEKVISTGSHELNTDFRKIFINYAQDKYDIKESIWEVEFWGNNSVGIYTNGGKVGINNGIRYRNGKDPVIANAIGYLYSSATLFDKYSYVSAPTGPSYDMRRDWTIFPYAYSWNNGANRTDSTAVNIVNKPFGRTAGKWRRKYETVEPRLDPRNSQNFPLLRYSDVLLMWAEADNELTENATPSSQAIEYVNHVRRRAYGKYLNGINNKSESIKSVEIISGGSNYEPSYTGEPATVFFEGGGGTAATAWVRIKNKAVSEFFLTDGGFGYAQAPNLRVQYGNGSGAVFKVTLTTADEADVPVNVKGSKVLFRQFIRDERARELAFELHRKWDLIRWGELDTEMVKAKNKANSSASETFRNSALRFYSNYSVRDTIWPIPAYELSVNGNLTPNGDW